jgi:nitrogen fixation protein NifU and related proteins
MTWQRSGSFSKSWKGFLSCYEIIHCLVEAMSQFPDVPLEGLYGDTIMDHYRNPRRRCPVRNADVEAHEFNPFCGDEVTLQIKLNDQGEVAEVSSVSQGCSIIQASASMMAELMAGKSPAELMSLSRLFRNMMQGNPLSEESAQKLGDLAALQVVRQYPVRIKCALLPWIALEEGISGL